MHAAMPKSGLTRRGVRGYALLKGDSMRSKLLTCLVAGVFVVAGTFYSRLEAEGEFQSLSLPSPKFRVKVAIKVDDTIKDSTYSYVSRELRRLGDVTVVETDTNDVDYRLEFLIIKLEHSAPGFVASCVMLKPMSTHMGRCMAGFKVVNPDIDLTALKSCLEWYAPSIIYGHVLHVDEELKSICERMVATFDSTVLKKQRKFQQLEQMKQGKRLRLSEIPNGSD